MTKELKQRIEEIANDNDWSVSFGEQRDETYAEFESYTDAGQDLIVTIWIDNKDESMSDVSAKLRDYAFNYDPDEEASKWIGENGHGMNGAPYHLSDILADMEDAKQMIYDLSDAMKE